MTNMNVVSSNAALTGERKEGKTVRYKTLPNGSVWPCPLAVTDIGWRLRYAPHSITRGDQLVLAEVVVAYREIIESTQVRRNRVCKSLSGGLGKAKNGEET